MNLLKYILRKSLKLLKILKIISFLFEYFNETLAYNYINLYY